MNLNEVSVYHPRKASLTIMDTLNESLGLQQRPKELGIQYKVDEEKTDHERMFTVGKWVSNVRIPKDGESSVYSSSNPASPSSPKKLVVPCYSPTSLDVFWRSNIEKKQPVEISVHAGYETGNSKNVPGSTLFFVRP